MIADGIYPDMPMAEYRAIEAASSSRLRDMGRSPAYCRYRMDHDAPQTDAMVRGSLVDCLLLEPHAEDERFAVKDFDARTKDGKARRDELADAGVLVLAEDEYQRARDIAAAVKRHPFWGALENVRPQVTAVVSGNPGRKARPDILALYGGEPVIVDLKVCRHASQDVYPRACWGLWHPQQLAWYRETLADLSERAASCWILAVHPEPPHEVTAYRMSDEMMRAAREVVLQREEKYAECVASGVWPDGDELVVVEAPAWVLSDEVIVEEE